MPPNLGVTVPVPFVIFGAVFGVTLILNVSKSDSAAHLKFPTTGIELQARAQDASGCAGTDGRSARILGQGLRAWIFQRWLNSGRRKARSLPVPTCQILR